MLLVIAKQKPPLYWILWQINFATLGIPLIIDRSADEKSELAKAEWLKVYGAVFGCSKKTDQLYNKAVKAAKSKTK